MQCNNYDATTKEFACRSENRENLSVYEFIPLNNSFNTDPSNTDSSAGYSTPDLALHASEVVRGSHPPL